MKKQNELLNAAKGLVCIAVVFMHCEFPGMLGIIVQAFSRFSVPFFFMISGYYCYYSENVEHISKINHKISRIGKITFYSTLFYLLIALLWGSSFYISFDKLISWIVFNEPFIIVGQLWFLFALLYDYIFFRFVCKTRTINFILAITPLLFIAYFSLAQGAHLLGMKVPNMFYRNWLIEGFAFFITGYWIHINQEKIQFSNKFLFVVFTLSTILCLPERYFLGRDFGVNICSIPQVTSLFLLATKNNTDKETWLSLIGKRYSMFVYILHPFVWHSLERIYKCYGISDNLFALYIMPIIVVVVTLILSHIVFVGNLKLNKVR